MTQYPSEFAFSRVVKVDPFCTNRLEILVNKSRNAAKNRGAGGAYKTLAYFLSSQRGATAERMTRDREASGSKLAWVNWFLP